MNDDQVKKLIEEADKIRGKNRTSCVELENYLYYQELKLKGEKSSSWVCGGCGSEEKTITRPTFKNSFKKLTKQEKATFYYHNVKCVEKLLSSYDSGKSNQQTSGRGSSSKNKTKDEEAFRISVAIKDDTWFKKWTNTEVQILPTLKIIKVLGIREELDLHNYLLRKSMNKERNCLALESTIEDRTIRISSNHLKNEQFNEMISKLINDAYQDNILKMLLKENKFPKTSKKNIKLKKAIEIDTSSQRESTLLVKEETVEQKKKMLEQVVEEVPEKTLLENLIKKKRLLDGYEQIRQGVYYNEKNNKVKKVYTFDESKISSVGMIQLLSNPQKFSKYKKNIERIRLTNKQVSQKKIFEQNHKFGSQTIGYTYERSYILKEGNHYFYDQHLNEEEGYYCFWAISSAKGMMEFIVEGKLGHNGEKNLQLSDKFIGDYSMVGQESNEENILVKDESDEDNMLEVSLMSEDFENNGLEEITNSQNQNFFYTIEGETTFIHDNHLPIDFDLEQHLSIQSNEPNLHKYIQGPLQKSNSIYLRSEQGHWLFEKGEWRVNDSGDVINVNSEKIKAQSSVLRLVFTRMGRNLFAGKSILNVSLPIQIFGNQSYLVRVCRGLIFAPTFLEKAAEDNSPLHRLINTFCFGLGFSIGFIRMEKPFNPILGETFQGMIDGCPVYAEQVSHHPPISSLLMKGRGYTVYGSLEAKVEMSFNSGSGINDGIMNVCFDEKDLKRNKITFFTPPGQISGLLYGDRKLSLVKKSNYIDEDNRLVLQVEWGKKKSSKNEFCKFEDYVEGEIIQVKQGVSLKDNKNLKIKASDIQSKHGKIYGRWTKSIFFSTTQIFNIQEQQPHLLQHYEPALSSDCRFRKDALLKRQGDIERAQNAKEELEEIQRRDRKLRKQMFK